MHQDSLTHDTGNQERGSPSSIQLGEEREKKRKWTMVDDEIVVNHTSRRSFKRRELQEGRKGRDPPPPVQYVGLGL